MAPSLLPLARPSIDRRDIAGVVDVLRSGTLSRGRRVGQFESAFARYLGTPSACAVSSGTAGLHLAVHALGLKPGDEVITSPFSFVASVNCILYQGATPVFADIEERAFGLSPREIDAKITPRTKAILVIHVFGQPAEMDPILRIAREHRLRVIEDACEGLGAKYHGQSVGTLGDVGVFAFYPNKQVTTGEGGMVVSRSPRLDRLCRSLRNQGRRDDDHALRHERLGYNYRLDEMSASLGVTQLAKIRRLLRQRATLAQRYHRRLRNIARLKLPATLPDRTHAWFAYVVRLPRGRRQRVRTALRRHGVETQVYFPALHLQPYLRRRLGYARGDFPLAEAVAAETLALPFSPGLRENDLRRIARIIERNV